MIDQTATTYDAPAVYLPHLIAWAERADNFYVADWARTRLVDISGLTLDDADEHAAIQAKTASLMARGVLLPDAPPSTLVGLTDWLRCQVGRWFPSLPNEMWQGVAYLLHHHRRTL